MARIWGNLSPPYRARLERKGISQSQYESGASLKAARGHERTPESRKDYLRNPGKYPERYRELRPLSNSEVRTLQSRAYSRLNHLLNKPDADGFTDVNAFSSQHVRDNVHAMTVSQLEFAISASPSQIREAASVQEPYRTDNTRNLFWYK